jgi:acetyl-CoA carboxylase biotin carboxyl carrier protein
MRTVPFDPDVIRMLATILTETGLTEIEIAEKDSRIRVARAPAPVAAYAPPALTAHTSTAGAAAASTSIATARDEASHPGAVLSPMVGIAYLAPEPGSPPYVTVGQAVSAGQTLLLIEAMKTFNQIKALKAGTVTRILVSSGAPVEYGEVLMIVE